MASLIEQLLERHPEYNETIVLEGDHVIVDGTYLYIKSVQGARGFVTVFVRTPDSQGETLTLEQETDNQTFVRYDSSQLLREALLV